MRVTLGGAAPKYVSFDETILGADRAAGPAVERSYVANEVWRRRKRNYRHPSTLT